MPTQPSDHVNARIAVRRTSAAGKRPGGGGPSSIQAAHVGAREESTWSTRSAASMNDVDADEHRHTMGRRGGAWDVTPTSTPHHRAVVSDTIRLWQQRTVPTTWARTPTRPATPSSTKPSPLWARFVDWTGSATPPSPCTCSPACNARSRSGSPTQSPTLVTRATPGPRSATYSDSPEPPPGTATADPDRNKTPAPSITKPTRSTPSR